MTRPPLARIALSLFLIAAGAMPVLSIPLAVSGLLPMHAEALFLVAPMSLLAGALRTRNSPEAAWALKGLIAGLVAVTAYDAMRIPMLLAGAWPDFIPRLGGWVLGTGGTHLLTGYLWRYLGDGGGIGLAFFVFCRMVASVRPSLISTHPILLSIGYGVFIWSGLLGTVAVIPHGAAMLFPLSPVSFFLSLLGHLIYGGVLGLFLSRTVARTTTGAAPQPAAMGAASQPRLNGLSKQR
ncbi:hypothetical protein ABZ235_16750 [Streptomyces canus]|uniref:hypothetical protein n=1 Tax=Streptomyces canus TaxID=58343 RepID=UPI0033BAA942